MTRLVPSEWKVKWPLPPICACSKITEPGLGLTWAIFFVAVSICDAIDVRHFAGELGSPMTLNHSQPPKVLAVGFSHLSALQRAYDQRVAKGTATFAMDTVNFNAERFRPVYTAKDGKRVYNETIRQELSERVAKEAGSKCLVLAALWGNEHFFMSAFNNPRPFDFALPKEPQRELSKTAEVIPYDLMYSLLNEICAAHYGLVSFLKGFMNWPIVAVSAPPPVDDVLSIAGGTSDPRLDEKVKELGVAPASLRYKFWRVCEEIHRQKSVDQGAAFLSVPTGTADGAGFRKREYYGTDWLHASVTYGELVLSQVDEILAKDHAVRTDHVRASV